MPDQSDINISDLSAMIEKLKSNPEIVTSVASALGMSMGTPSADGGSPDGDKSSSSLPDMISTLAPLLSQKSEKGHNDRESDHGIALLHALRPYLSPERQEIIDYLMKFSKIGELLKKLQ